MKTTYIQLWKNKEMLLILYYYLINVENVSRIFFCQFALPL